MKKNSYYYPPYQQPRSGTYVNCPYGNSLQVTRIGHPVCLGVNEILCRDGWKFGIIQTGSGDHAQTHLELRRDNADDDRIVDLVYRKFPSARSLCISEHYQNVAVLSVAVDDGTWYLVAPNAGNPKKLPRLKIVEDAGDANDRDHNHLVVRFRDGAGEDDTLWELFASGYAETASDAAWFFMDPPTKAPTVSPSDSPSARPTVSARPSWVPSATPSVNPTRSAAPSASPTSR